jgi:hypothetical protein
LDWVEEDSRDVESPLYRSSPLVVRDLQALKMLSEEAISPRKAISERA